MKEERVFYSCCAERSQIDLVRASGFDGIVFRGVWLAAQPLSQIRVLRGELEATGLVSRSVNAFCQPSVALTGPDFDAKKLADYTAALAERAVLLGIRDFGIGSPLSRQLSADYDRQRALEQWEEALLTMADICEPFAIRVLAEAVCTRECNFMNTTAETLAAVRRLDRDNLGLVFDLYHEVVMGENAGILEQALPYIRVLHIAEDRAGQKYYPEGSVRPAVEPYLTALRGRFHGEFAVEASVGEAAVAFPAALRVMRGLLA